MALIKVWKNGILEVKVALSNAEEIGILEIKVAPLKARKLEC